MPTPNTYDYESFSELLSNAGNLFHQTSINNIDKILQAKAILSPGTSWGLNRAPTNLIYDGNSRREKNLKLIANRGFVDYAFCSFLNGLSHEMNLYGTVSLEIDKKILLDKEAFAYLFNFVMDWPGAKSSDKYSDLSTWNHTIQYGDEYNYNEILVRRKINLDKYLVGFHCVDNYYTALLGKVNRSSYNGATISQYAHQPLTRNGYMENERKVEINGVTYKAILSADGRFVSVFENVSTDEVDLIGRYEYDEATDELFANFPMSNRKVPVGRMIHTGSATGSNSAQA